MRALPPFLAAATLLALAAAGAAQDPDGEPGCAQSNPCEVILELGAQGIVDLAPDRFGTGDWVLFSIYNADEANHTVSLEGHDFEVSVPGGDLIDTQPIQLGDPGSYELRDQPSGDAATVTVEAEEVFTDGGAEDDSDGSGSGRGSPGAAPVLVLALLAALAIALRRK